MPGAVGLDQVVLDHPVALAIETERILLDALHAVLPHRERPLLQRGQAAALVVAKGPVEVLALDVEGAELAPVRKSYLAPAGDVVADLTDRPNRVLQGEVADDHARVLEHAQQDARRAHLEKGRVLAHVRVAHDHVQPPEALRIGVGFVAGVDDRAAPRRRGRDPLPDVLGPLAETEDRPPRGLQHLAGAGVDLPADEERDQYLGVVREVVAPAREVVLVASVGVAG